MFAPTVMVYPVEYIVSGVKVRVKVLTAGEGFTVIVAQVTVVNVYTAEQAAL